MLTTPHSLVGATIAVLVPNPILSVPLAIGSHFILDTVFHWQETLYPYKSTKETWIRIIIDLTLSISLVSLIAKSHPNISFTIWLAAFAANTPDLDSITVLIPGLIKNNIVRNYWNWHCKIQRETSAMIGLLPQVILSVVCWIIAMH